MSRDLAGAGRALAIAAALAAWAVAAHYSSALVEESHWGAALAMAPFVAIAAAFAWRSSHRLAMLALLGVATIALFASWTVLSRNVGWLYFVQHVGTNILLAIGFGRTLRSGREPMCTRIATLMHGEISPALAAYTRKVTVAWTGFFALTVTVSVLLFAFGSLAAWSTFANLLTLPLVVLMFVAEYLVRLKAVPEDRSSIFDAVRAYRRSSQASAASSPSTPSAIR